MNQQLLAKTFVELADNLVADFDLIDFLRLLTDRCVGMLGAGAAGVLLADRDGKLRVMAASDEQVRLLELFQLQNDEGPCLECFRTGAPVIVPDLTREVDRWPRFVTAAHRSGFGAVQALPMRLRDEVVGALNLFRATPGPFDPAATLIAQALADVATISLLQQRTTHRSTVLNEQLQTALNSRVLIEQAKGKLAERQNIDMEQAFTALRGYARSHNRRLVDVARAFINGSEPLVGLGA
ncbi:ANTAR domain-containing protein [Streptomyces phaeochromogenes]|uniref:GAF and ANTAR domain-containing protein n=1 Tax=Streptomyces phaeochromogenes TaxID=1923 RepID=A0ABZ1H254_STRPH|nr:MULTISPECIES: GAF and ANTAR domain-containing protein [Streptomyces]MCX5602135.1 GAF and ANTAR domain-containing protein [Streptomyces phaeochromogenes]MCZ4508040.1 GAF and ANTAR domain-containing protein [Streptomyces sp. ActVer]WRZ27080.1 GAF and ANTAR domain-containing protein [Streptomyces phaeochromogenes]WSD12644.1 GAF and ANTAR domain-containing protein [Streptomyces phaeochromogenes]WSJ10560.1 GAF and ANTAR domain-containing protein [Streptomyces phaeochromogenes]